MKIPVLIAFATERNVGCSFGFLITYNQQDHDFQIFRIGFNIMDKNSFQFEINYQTDYDDEPSLASQMWTLTTF